jgi:predicted Zn-dependent protease
MGRLVLAGTLLVGSVSGCGRVLAGAVTALPAFLINEQQEVALGARAAQQILAQAPLVQSASLQEYVGRLGAQAAAVSERPNLPYRFFVIQDAQPNAFALPGGFIFVTSGLLGLMENEAQLMGVLAHEVGHVAAKHHTEMIREAAIAQGVAVAAVGAESQATQQIAGVIAQLVLRGMGRQDELESDRLGAQYTAQLGYDPTQLATFLQRLNSATGNTQPPWLYPLSTHPPVEQRINELSSHITTNTLQGSKVNREEFLRAIGATP